MGQFWRMWMAAAGRVAMQGVCRCAQAAQNRGRASAKGRLSTPSSVDSVTSPAT